VKICTFYREVYHSLRLLGRSAGTDRQYRNALRHFERTVGREVDLDELTDKLLADCLGQLIAEGRSTSTANKVRRHIFAIWRFAVEQKMTVAPMPTLRKLPEPRRLPEAWTIEEMDRIFATVDRIRGYTGKTPSRLWWKGLLLTAYYTGLRISAIMALERKHLRGSVLHVPAELQKQNADQVFDLPDDCVKVVCEMFNFHESRWLFPWPYDRYRKDWPALVARLRKTLKAAELPAGRKDLFHKIRRTTASHLDRVGGNATAMLGHSSEAVTMGYLDQTITGTARFSKMLPRVGN